MAALTHSELDWAEQARLAVLRGNVDNAESLLSQALTEHPRSFELRRILAAIHQQSGRSDQAECSLRELLTEKPGDTGAAFALARLLLEQGRSKATGFLMRDWFERNLEDVESIIHAIELLDDGDCKADAAEIAEKAIATFPNDARLRAYAAMLDLQLGRFERSRQHYLFALSHDARACEWHAPHGLASAQRYKDAAHPDFALFKNCLQREGLSDKARASLLFALGKAHDDIGDWSEAASYYRRANQVARALAGWTRKSWRRSIEARLASPLRASSSGLHRDIVPIFIVGMPRSGTTLLAELLARDPLVCNRGESPWLPKLAQDPELSVAADSASLDRAAATYAMHMRRDDALSTRWFIDKQPLNFRYVDLMLALFPNARVLYCRRSPRDTALSLWMQSFIEGVQGYAYDFADIALVMRDCERLMGRWQSLYPDSILSVHYEDVVADSINSIERIRAWLQLPGRHGSSTTHYSYSISTASMWQARQPIFGRSVHRWRTYIDYVPELLRFLQ